MNTSSVLSPLAKIIALVITLLACISAQASVIISSTRVIYPQNDREVTVRLESKNHKPVLIQVWLDNGDENSTPQVGDVPFVATPPILRMEPEQQQVIRLAYTGEPLPPERESLFWLNVLEVPSQQVSGEQSNRLQLAFRSRIKVFFRPHNLPYTPDAAPAKLQWRHFSTDQGQGLELYNPTPYYVSFDQVDMLAAGQRHTRAPSTSGADSMVEPNGHMRLLLPGLKSAPYTATAVEFQTLDDFGTRVSHKASVSQ
ncbi:pili assembly chaperone [Pseudomonas fluorescens]|uniref:Pili assembly chaperone n=1 Tax=Pseudomonas fluorescens TaxID=294 RepID=A0A379I6C6_PSEFL|nr:fimbria/pilus periplasmic chaperone [Pseudomonas fluorescens]AIG04364.1 pilus assembly protein [Pseudomonas fluorescens]SUD27644.1 pili assembly chaperone [Pseudomonas fluorescens]